MIIAADGIHGTSVANEVLIRGWQEGSGKDLLELATDLSSLPIFGFLYTNVEVEGRLEGMDTIPIKALKESTDRPLIVSGGITSIDDLELLREMGAHSVVVGMAIYTGRIFQEGSEGVQMKTGRKDRAARLTRETRETKISLRINIDGSGSFKGEIPDEFLRHMVETLAKYAGSDVEMSAMGDIKHHLVEDVAIVLGRGFREAGGLVSPP